MVTNVVQTDANKLSQESRKNDLSTVRGIRDANSVRQYQALAARCYPLLYGAPPVFHYRRYNFYPQFCTHCHPVARQIVECGPRYYITRPPRRQHYNNYTLASDPSLL